MLKKMKKTRLFLSFKKLFIIIFLEPKVNFSNLKLSKYLHLFCYFDKGGPYFNIHLFFSIVLSVENIYNCFLKF